MLGKSFSEYVKTLKYFFLAVLVIGIIQISYDNAIIALLKFVIIFFAGFYVVKNRQFNLKQAACSGFLLYIVVIWLQPMFSGMSTVTIGIILADFAIAAIAALVGGVIAKKFASSN